MNTDVRRKLKMAARVREFVRTHSATESSYAPALTRLEERLTRAEAIAARQHTGRTVAKGARDRRKELRHILHFQLLRYLTAVGSVAATSRADLAARFKLPHGNATNSSFVTSVKALIAVAEEQKELLVQEGMDAALLDDLKARVSEFEATLQTVLAARRDHIGARADTGRRRPGGVRGGIAVPFPAALRDREPEGAGTERERAPGFLDSSPEPESPATRYFTRSHITCQYSPGLVELKERVSPLIA